MAKKRVLSGIRATGQLHLGNLKGAVEGMLALQDDSTYETLYMVADLHSINTPYSVKTFKDKVRGVVLDYLAAGLDPAKSTIFVQSKVPEHVELSYLMSSVLTVARMMHLPTYKDKIKENSENANMAMLYYPVLMAADILIYKADAVPVGDDQLPHLEVAREVARKMNERYGTDFPEPIQFKTEGHYVPSLMGEGKMSKSVEGSFINITDDKVTISEKLAKVPTDSGKGVEIPDAGGVFALLELVELFEGKKKKEEYIHDYKSRGIKYSELKSQLSRAIIDYLQPLQKRRGVFEKDSKKVDRILEEGAEKAREIAKETLKEVKIKMGLI